MNQILTNLLSASVSGSVIILLVLAARIVLRKAPRSTICLLWVMAGLRLLMPFQIESPFSLQPELPPAVSQMEQQASAPDIQPDNAVIPDQLPLDATVTYDDNAVTQPTIHVVNYGEIAVWVWIAGTCVLTGYTLLSYLMLRRKVSDAIPAEDGVYESDAIDTPFLLGYIHPRIYLPKGLNPTDRPHILAHERAHMDRGDNWIKLMGFLCVSIHWFNPLVWLGYHLLCKDIEMACDESVVKHMDLDSRKRYSTALVNCSTRHRFGACPVAFGEISVNQRVLSVLHYRKPGFRLSLACLLVIGITAGCFMTNPVPTPADTKSGFSPEDTTPTDSAQITALCRDAYTQFVGDNIYEIQVDTEYASKSGIMNYSTQTRFWRHGNDWLRQYTIHEQNFVKTEAELCRGGNVFEFSIPAGGTAPEWSETNDSPQLSHPWTMELDWDSMTFQGVDGASGSRGYLFLLNGDPDNYITFCFSAEGKLLSINHRFILVTPMDTISHVTVECRLISNDPEQIAFDIAESYHRALVNPITDEYNDLQNQLDANNPAP